MKTNMLLGLGALAPVGCGGVEGSYTLDKAETKKSMEAEIAKLPASDQEMAKLGLAMIDAMDVSMELKSGGVATSKSQMKGLGDGKTQEDTGTWKKDGDSVIIATGKDAKGELKCAKNGKSLSCTAGGDTKSKMTLVFTKA
jgi:hypothetical protein